MKDGVCTAIREQCPEGRERSSVVPTARRRSEGGRGKQERWTEEQVDAELTRHDGNSTMPSYLNAAQPWRMNEGGSIERPLWRSMASRRPGGLGSLDDGRGYVVTAMS